MPSGYDVAIVGGGAIGSSIAYALTVEPGFRGSVLVVERDPTYRQASSALSASGIRQQFSAPVNIRMSQYGIEFLRRAGELLACGGERAPISITEAGYLVLARPQAMDALRRNHARQLGLGARIALLSPAELQARFPWLAVDDLGGGCLGLEGEGWLDGYLLVQALRARARAGGVTYLRDEVIGMGGTAGRVDSLQLASGASVNAGTVVNAAGPHARAIAAMAGVQLPVEARKRNVFVVACAETLPGCPLVCDGSGVWFRPEGAHYICGCAPAQADDQEDFSLQPDHAYFEAVVWPALAARVPAFAALRLTGAWAGHYEYNCFDQNGIVGLHPEVRNFVLANGFSGHGLQQSPAVGRAVAELIAHGEYRTLDLSELAYGRMAAGQPVHESGIY
ncbi:MAG: FAD-binding oxidoreductase [Gammaproteobacteria bacterium]|nr:FAD-binding oxidoreductase [Gammaproteobacteria bacterium]MDE2250596.1 FAD-binding oxidoreductase [Gammaproteobacteria bacterium]